MADSTDSRDGVAVDQARVAVASLSARSTAILPSAGSSRTPVQRASRIRMLTKPAEFERCLSRPPIARSGAFALHVAQAAAMADATQGAGPEADVWRLGLVIPKRYEASAVARNTIKRRWRAAFAGAHVACAVEFGAADVVVRMQSALVGKRSAPDVVAALAPAKRRARTTFDPQAILGVLVDRMRRVTTGAGAPATRRASRVRPS